MDDKYRRALVFINVQIDFLKDRGLLEQFILFAVQGLMREGWKQDEIAKLIAAVKDEVQREIHGKVSH